MTALRRYLLVILSLGVVGTGVDLLLLEHTEGFWQLAPFIVLGLSTLTVVLCIAHPSRLGIRALRFTMVVLVVIGILGVYLHYKGNAEFELEMYPSLAGLDLFWEALKGATPALAPGAMALLGLLGLTYTHEHPALNATRVDRSTDTPEGHYDKSEI